MYTIFIFKTAIVYVTAFKNVYTFIRQYYILKNSSWQGLYCIQFKIEPLAHTQTEALIGVWPPSDS